MQRSTGATCTCPLPSQIPTPRLMVETTKDIFDAGLSKSLKRLRGCDHSAKLHGEEAMRGYDRRLDLPSVQGCAEARENSAYE